MSTIAKITNAEDALLELIMFFVRHQLAAWPTKLQPVLEALRAKDATAALNAWSVIPLMGEYGLMQVEIVYEYGYRVQDLQAERVHFQRLLEQALNALNNLRAYVRTGANRPLLEIYLDSLSDLSSIPLFTAQDSAFMQRALSLAQQGGALGEVPVGAVLVLDGQIIGEGYNQPILSNDPTAHAEVVAIRQAATALQNYRLENTTLYVTLEPCTMCVGALVHARIGRVVFAATEPKSGSLVSARQLFETGYYNHVFVFEGGLLADEASKMLSDFFRGRREAKKASSI